MVYELVLFHKLWQKCIRLTTHKTHVGKILSYHTFPNICMLGKILCQIGLWGKLFYPHKSHHGPTKTVPSSFTIAPSDIEGTEALGKIVLWWLHAHHTSFCISAHSWHKLCIYSHSWVKSHSPLKPVSLQTLSNAVQRKQVWQYLYIGKRFTERQGMYKVREFTCTHHMLLISCSGNGSINR